MYYNFADLEFVNQELAQIWPGWTAVKVLGKGGFGAVYEIHRNVRGNLEKAALKIMRIPENDMEVNQLRMQGMTEQNTEDYYKKSVDDTYKEIAIMQKFVGHSHLVSYEDYTIRKRPKDIGWDIYIRMELLTGLVDYARNRTLDEETVLKMGVHISQGLSVCHKKGVIHRDIKPQNIFVNENGDFKLGDFGVSRKAPGTHDVLSFKGTLAYMAPEVYRMLSTDERSDIYSLGVVLYQCLNDNRLPFVPDPFTPQDLETARMRRFNGEQIPEPAHGSPELKAIVLKSLEVSPEDRFQTAEEMYYALSDIYRRDYGRRFTTTGPKDTSKRRAASALETTVLSDSGSVSSSSGSVSSGTGGAEPVHVVRGYTVTDSEADAEPVRHSSTSVSQSSGSMGTGQQSSNTGAGQSSGSVYGSQPSGNTGSNQAGDSFESQSGNTGTDQDGNTTGRRRYVSTKGTSANKQRSATYEGAPAGGGSTPPKKPDDKKKIIMIIAAAVAVLFLVLFLSKDQILKYDQKGMFHKHQWEEATCTRAKTCTICGAKTGRLAEHQWVEATCTEPKTCSVCGKTEGEPAGHDWAEATCTKPKTCSVCGETEGEALGHDWLDATYDEPKTCARCGETEGYVLGYVPFTEFTGTFSEEAVNLGDYQVYPLILAKELIGCRKMQIGYGVNEVEGDILGEFELWGKSDGEWVVLGTFDVTEEDQRYVNVFTIDPARNISEIVCKPSTARGVSSWNCYYNLVDAQVTVD